MLEKSVVSLNEVLINANSIPWRHALYAERVKDILITTRCVVLDPDDVDEDEDDLPQPAKQLGFDYVIDIQTVKSICANMLDQNPQAVIDDLYKAFLFYMANDAFIAV